MMLFRIFFSGVQRLGVSLGLRGLETKQKINVEVVQHFFFGQFVENATQFCKLDYCHD
jgi:hypothetical protein